jgi:hypothetical protein
MPVAKNTAMMGVAAVLGTLDGAKTRTWETKTGTGGS